MNPVVALHQVDFSYNTLPVLNNISLQVAPGEFLGIVGPNGGGKSTLLKLILGLLTPHAGQVTVLGDNACNQCHRLGYVPQYPGFSRDFPISVREVVNLGRLGRQTTATWWQALRPQHITPADHRAVTQALAEVEATDLAERQIGSLSGGQLQRVLLARALASEPVALLLDEPTANIDQRLESDIFDLLQQLNRRMTILVVSHDVGFISSYVTRVACINQTLVCHQTDAIDGQVIQNLYGEQVRMVAHHHL
jgi:zinc transport system ATP-binding protein